MALKNNIWLVWISPNKYMQALTLEDTDLIWFSGTVDISLCVVAPISYSVLVSESDVVA